MWHCDGMFLQQVAIRNVDRLDQVGWIGEIHTPFIDDRSRLLIPGFITRVLTSCAPEKVKAALEARNVVEFFGNVPSPPVQGLADRPTLTLTRLFLAINWR
jgi:hypothetical protein